MPVRFLTRVASGKKGYLTFYVPKYVKDFYGLKSGSYKGGVTLSDGTSANYRVWFSRYKRTLRGRIPDSAAKTADLVEIWVYRDSWEAGKP